MCCVTKVTLVYFIDGKCHIKKLNGKSRKTCLTNHTWPISHHIMPMVINALRGTHTCIHMYAHASTSGAKAISGADTIYWITYYFTRPILIRFSDLLRYE